MKQFLTSTGLALAFLLTIAAGLFLVTSTAGRVVVALCILAAVAYGARNKIFDTVQRVRTYPALLQRASTAEREAEKLRNEVAALTVRGGEAYVEGIEEGKMQVIGAALAARVGAPPVLFAVSNTDGLALVAEYAPEVGQSMSVGMRFEVQVTKTGESKGVVEVVKIEPSERMVYLRPVQKTVPEFWEKLEAAAAADPSPPALVRLAPFRFALPDALRPPPEMLADALMNRPPSDASEEQS